jgi:transposase
MVVLTDAQWAVLEPLVEACRPHAKVPPSDLRRTVEAIIWRCANGAKWRSIPAELGPWWKAAQTFIRWARLGVWDRLLDMAHKQGVELGMAFLDGTNIRAHAKAAGAPKRGDLAEAAAKVRRLGALVAATERKPWSSLTPAVGPSASG